MFTFIEPHTKRMQIIPKSNTVQPYLQHIRGNEVLLELFFFTDHRLVQEAESTIYVLSIVT